MLRSYGDVVGSNLGVHRAEFECVFVFLCYFRIPADFSPTTKIKKTGYNVLLVGPDRV